MDSRMELTAVVLAEIEACSFRNKTIAETAAHIVRCSYINGEVIRLDGGIRMAPK